MSIKGMTITKKKKKDKQLKKKQVQKFHDNPPKDEGFFLKIFCFFDIKTNWK
jgi:hypothetical protein